MLLRFLVAICGLAMLSPSTTAPARAPLNGLPELVVWAWERPEDLRALDPDIGVAFLAQTIAIDDRGVRVDPRRQPLQVAPAARVAAVTRIEADAGWTATLDPGLTSAVASAIAATAGLRRVRAVQVDFDARASERAFYRGVIRAVRAALAPDVSLSITALASWCVGDDWLGGLPVDEAVPMLFEMGPEHAPFRVVAQSRAAAASACRGAVGVSLGEPLSTNAQGRRVYVFNPKPWTTETLAHARIFAEP